MRKALLFSIAFILTAFISYPSVSAESDNSMLAEIDIGIQPDDVLFDIDNMKPGDWAPRTITVQNIGKMNLDYSMHVKNNGSTKLFNELMLEITDSSQTIYSGKIADFDNLPLRSLKSSTEEDLEITVRFPEHLGNEYQGLDSSFTFIFTAEGTEDPGGDNPGEEDPDDGSDTDDKDYEGVDGSVDSGDGGSELPDTATNMFNFLFIGGILIISGGLIALLARRNKLEI
ncbi:TasA family protein [Ornithinibacillus xuwenensis]|uniref:TasA family protein n=1 Tax=Ornithinibacillus xuwenensis TaxID=3144668 RepID=A0ABU9XKA2_9BACI